MYRVIVSRGARNELAEIRRYIATKASPLIAANYVSSILEFCQSLASSPHRGEERAELRRGIRTIGFRDRVSVAFSVLEDEQVVQILGISYGGHSWKKL